MADWEDDDDGEEWGDSLGREERGCGKRTKGGIYAEVPFDSPFGHTMEHFLVDPPLPIHDPKAYGVTPLGVQLLERNGVWHVFDWIGAKHYPNVWDFIEEGKRLGVSRRLPKTLDFAKLTDESRIIFIHPRAYIENRAGLLPAILQRVGSPEPIPCPKSLVEHEAPSNLSPPMCVEFCRHDTEGGEAVEQFIATGAIPELDAGRVTRTIATTTYSGWERPEGFTPTYVPAVFLSLPLQRIAVIRGKGDDEAMEKVSKSRLPARLWDE